MYALKKEQKTYTIEDIICKGGYPLKIKRINIELFVSNMIYNLVKIEYNKDYYDLINKILFFLNNEESDDSAENLLGELERIRLVLFNKYEKYLNKDMINEYIKNIRLLKNELEYRLLTVQKKRTFLRR